MNKNHLEELIVQVEHGQVFNYLCFWGHRQVGQQLSKSCFSQWFPAPFVADGITYPTAEHYMMAGKARVFKDGQVLADILQASDPDAVKRLGRKVKNYDEQTWIENRFQIVVDGNFAKFSQHPDMAAFLLRTGNSVIVEASPVDRIWGIGMAKDDPACQDPRQWQGLNLLGFALMEVRHRLRSHDA